jgi:hypothetical protein
MRTLPAAALDQLPADRRRLIILYYGLQGEAEHSLQEVRLKLRMGHNRSLRLLREAEHVLLGPASASG